MATTDPLGGALQVLDGKDVIQLKDDSVNFKDVHPSLFQFVVHMGYVHRVLFGDPLVITSGKDGVHTQGSKHGLGLAVDVRVKDLDEADQNVFISVLVWASLAREVSVFDERGNPKGGHVHIEFHGQ